MVCLTVSLFEIIISCVKLLIPATRCLVYPKWVQEKKIVPNVQLGNVYMPYFRLEKLALSLGKTGPFQPRPAEPWCNKS